MSFAYVDFISRLISQHEKPEVDVVIGSIVFARKSKDAQQDSSSLKKNIVFIAKMFLKVPSTHSLSTPPRKNCLTLF